MVRLGIIGVGGIAQNKHIPGIQEAEGGVITAICDINSDTLKKVGDKLGIPEDHRFLNYQDLIACEDVDAVEICTPNDVHVAAAVAAAKADKPFECEKPLSISMKAAEELQEVMKEHPVKTMMCYSYRYMPAVRYAKWIVEQNMLGRIISADVAYLKDSAMWEGRRLDWRFDKAIAGSGVLGDLGAHLIDMAQFLIGDFISVCGTKQTVVPKRQRLDSEEWADVTTDDYCSFIAQMEGGVNATFSITRAAQGHRNTIKFDLFAENGTISFDLNHPEVLNICIGKIDIDGGGMHTVKVPKKYYFSQEQMFINVCNGGPTPYLPTIEDGYRDQKIIDAVLLSTEERRWVDCQ